MPLISASCIHHAISPSQSTSRQSLRSFQEEYVTTVGSRFMDAPPPVPQILFTQSPFSCPTSRSRQSLRRSFRRYLHHLMDLLLFFAALYAQSQVFQVLAALR